MTLPLESVENNTKRCVDIINRYWEEKGLTVNAVAVCMTFRQRVHWTIKSNLVDGLPKGITYNQFFAMRNLFK